MKICFDYRMKNWSGIGRYCSNLINELITLCNDNDFSILSNDNKENITCDVKISKSPVFSIMEQIEIPLLNIKNKIDLFHSPHFVFPVFGANKLILTIHDLTPFIFPKDFSIFARLYIKFMLNIAKYKADKIIVVSENTKKDLIRLFKFLDSKIKVIYHGVDSKFHPIEESSKIKFIKEKYKTGENFILYTGNIKPNKNVSRLIEALAIINKNRDIKLVIAGKKYAVYHKVLKEIEENNLNENVIFTEFVSDEDLVLLYNAATVFVYPSLYEGFGFPPLEAMACGVPVITSNTSSLLEVVGDAAITIDPYDVNGLASAITSVLENPDLQRELRIKGLLRAKSFSWSKAAKETYDLYEEVLKTKS